MFDFENISYVVKKAKIFQQLSYVCAHSTNYNRTEQEAMKVINILSLLASIYLTLTRTLDLIEDPAFKLDNHWFSRGAEIRVSTICTGICALSSLMRFGQDIITDLNLE